MIRKLVTALFLGAAMLAPAAANAGWLHAGAARADITPPPTLLPAPGLMKLTSVHDPIFARVLILDNGGDKVALIAADAIILMGTGDLIDSIAKELKIPRDRIMVTATHNHNGPILGMPGPYYDFAKKSLLDAVRQANAGARPARIGYRTGKAYVNVNRDERVGDRYTMGYAPEAPSDKTVAVLTVTDTAGKPIAVYANYPVHGVVMFGSGMKDSKYEVTGDLPGATSRYVETELGKDVVALWTSGAAGDQNPLFMAARLLPGGGIEDAGAGGYALVNAVARRLGDEILRVVKDTRELSDSADLKVRTTSLVCPGQKPKAGAKPLPSPIPGGADMFETVDDAPVDIPLTLMTIGDIALAGVGGELFTEIGMAIKAQSPFDRTMVVTNLPDGVGYIPSERGYDLPSEKAVGARMKRGCAEVGMPATFKAMATEILTAPAPKK